MKHTRYPLALLSVALVLGLLAAALPARGEEAAAQAGRPIWVYVGTVVEGKAEPGAHSIYRVRMDLTTGALSPAEVACVSPDPYYLTMHPNGKFLYAANLSRHTVDAFSLSRVTGAVTLLNHQPAMGDAPAYVSIDATGRHALVANYTGGNIASLPIEADGKLGPATSVIQYNLPVIAGKKKQSPPPAHCIVLDRSNRFALVCELGLDKVMVCRFDARTGKLTPNDPPSAMVANDTQPRHLAFDPTQHFIYVIGEKDMTVTVFSWDSDHGVLEEVQKISTIDGAVRPGWSGAEIHVHPNGKFLYASLRGPNSLAIFAIDEKTGKLAPPARQSTLGKMPQHFAIDPTGTFLVAANEDSDNIVVFRIDAITGLLTPTGATAHVPGPTCILFVPTADR